MPKIRDFLNKFGLLGFKRKSKLTLLFVLSFGIKFFLALFLTERSTLFLIGDATLLIKKRQYFLASLAIASFASFKLILMFNSATKKQLKWLDLFDVLESNAKLPIFLINPILLQEIRNRVKIYKNLVKLNLKVVPVTMVIIYVEMILKSPTFLFAIINVFWLFYHTYVAYYLTGMSCVTIICVEIVCLFILKRVILLNHVLDGRFKTWFRIQEIKLALKEHADTSQHFCL